MLNAHHVFSLILYMNDIQKSKGVLLPHLKAKSDTSNAHAKQTKKLLIVNTCTTMM